MKYTYYSVLNVTIVDFNRGLPLVIIAVIRSAVGCVCVSAWCRRNYTRMLPVIAAEQRVYKIKTSLNMYVIFFNIYIYV